MRLPIPQDARSLKDRATQQTCPTSSVVAEHSPRDSRGEPTIGLAARVPAEHVRVLVAHKVDQKLSDRPGDNLERVVLISVKQLHDRPLVG